jgi:nucleoside-triphosphatase
MKKNIFLTGAPSSGKTTVIKRVIAGLDCPANGFYTQEERMNIETVAVPSIEPRNTDIIILDEIGKMECFSEVFKRAAVKALDSPNIVIGTITFGGDDFIKGIKNRDDMELFEVTTENRDALPGSIIEKISKCIN